MPDHEVVEILLVEDNPTDAELTMEALKEGGVGSRLLWVKDGAQALDYMFSRGSHAEGSPQGRPKLVLLDLLLPKVDGLEVLEALKSNPATRSVPVVVLTSSHEPRDVERSYQFGVNSFVSKPVHFETFARVVAQLGQYWTRVNQAAG